MQHVNASLEEIYHNVAHVVITWSHYYNKFHKEYVFYCNFKHLHKGVIFQEVTCVNGFH